MPVYNQIGWEIIPLASLSFLHINGNIGENGKRALKALRPSSPNQKVSACDALDNNLMHCFILWQRYHERCSLIALVVVKQVCLQIEILV